MAGVYFGGQQIYKPGAYSQVDASGMVPISLGGQRVLAIIGSATGTEDSPLEYNRIYWFNNPSQARKVLGSGDLLVGAEIAWSGGNDVGADLIACVPLETDETTGEPTTEAWANALALLETEPIDGIIPMSDEATVHAQVKEHISSLSGTTRRRERRGFFGHALGEESTAVQERVASLGTHRAVQCSPGIIRAVNGEVKTLSAVYTACAVAGLWAGLELGEPLTFKYINALGLEKVYDDLEIDDMLQAGVMVIEEVPAKGRRIVQQLTCHTADENALYKELSVSTLADYMSKNLREKLEDKFVGKKNSPTLQTSIYNTVISLLNEFEREGWIVGDRANGIPAYRNVNVVRDGRAYTIDWEGSPGEPVNWILITSHFVSE